MSKELPSPPITSESIELMESKTPACPSTNHTIATATIWMMPSAIESTKEVFITDHASICTSRSWAIRCLRGGTATASPATAAGFAGAALAGVVAGFAGVVLLLAVGVEAGLLGAGFAVGVLVGAGDMGFFVFEAGAAFAADPVDTGGSVAAADAVFAAGPAAAAGAGDAGEAPVGEPDLADLGVDVEGLEAGPEVGVDFTGEVLLPAGAGAEPALEAEPVLDAELAAGAEPVPGPEPGLEAVPEGFGDPACVVDPGVCFAAPFAGFEPGLDVPPEAPVVPAGAPGSGLVRLRGGTSGFGGDFLGRLMLTPRRPADQHRLSHLTPHQLRSCHRRHCLARHCAPPRRQSLSPWGSQI